MCTPTMPVVLHGILDAGTSYLQKPFTPAGLTEKIQDVLSQHKR
jgi:hypothetical protein